MIKSFTSILFRLTNLNVKVIIGNNSLIYHSKVNTKRFFNKNNIRIGNNVNIINCTFNLYGSSNDIIIEEGAKLDNVTFWIEDNQNLIKIGKKTTFHGTCQLAACEGTAIQIGNDCMFSHDIYIRTTDSHSIIKNNKRINKARNIIIGNHVWIGMQTLILKGSNIPDGCIIGARSTISSSDMEKKCIYAGHPIKLINKEIEWKRERI